MANQKIIDRIRALLALASNNPSEAEATSAAGRAAQLMQEHDLEQAEIEASGGEVEAEPIVDEEADDNGGKSRRDMWKSVLLYGIGQLFGVTVYAHDSKEKIFGRSSSVRTATYTYRYLANEIERLSERYWRLLEDQSVGKRSATNDFRRGCAGRLQVRMKEIKAEQDNAAQASAGALIVIAKHDEETALAWKGLLKARNWKDPGSSSNRCRLSAANLAGRSAADSLRIHGDGSDSRTLGSAPLPLGPVGR